MTLLENQTMLPPCNLEAEKRLCGTLILDRELINDVVNDVRPDYFYAIPNQYIYESICTLFIDGDPVTPETVANSLNQKKEMDGKSRLEIIGGAKYIFSTLEGVGPEEFEYWLDVVKRKYDERKLLEFGNEVRRLALSSPDDVTKLRSKLEEKLIGLSGRESNSSISIENAIPDLDDRITRYIENPYSIIGLPTTYRRLDEALDGLQAGNVSIIYAPSSRFKSLFATNIGWHLAEQNIPLS